MLPSIIYANAIFRSSSLVWIKILSSDKYQAQYASTIVDSRRTSGNTIQNTAQN